MKGITVCVDYSDLLEVTLPRNQHHFKQIAIVTAPHDEKTKELVRKLSRELPVEITLIITDSFYDDGADFNKWKALEEGLDFIGRKGLLCIFDADVIWPKKLPHSFLPSIGNLYSPVRRMYTDFKSEVPPEEYWMNFPLHRNLAEFAGYTQIFFGEDPVLGTAPWHEINWRHAGGADSFFQQKWKQKNKIRPDFEVLHLGEAGKNWFGRSTPYLDGSKEPEAEERERKYFKVWRERRRLKSFDQEKL